MAATNLGPRGISDERVVQQTGRSTADWEMILDAWDVRAHGHTATARYLREQHGLSGWWAQAVTIRYEYARDLRQPLVVPDDLLAALAAEPAALSRFDALTATHRREVAEYVSEAKRPETRARRLETMVAKLRDGLPL
jgi:hypothetical protein